ncbi:bifunctional phosphoribosylaminoimidazolecarboxamide formyltransferase/IMP cyclohydrolase [Carnobacterium maltaromaticum]|uniref:bifunctional phosphoribosylaminoimidazolecarboxamide formyltransferase/IMP cyclohydrolase n=1 Tax=Carnobacterium maltaromaticum TaxID=2751 RepID=UPI000E73855D|nr:bifunctional phosphoribosylaminoimidazolecarboxamide formyltransferase/IMP cyclohydrolase [Carnobacterium maltaromaticum]AOA02692.1 bifunctional phosphoribosylaminoimidazolecarboxamide formyltransferase/IMP cyclohydrolase [Carnobacterium maltaromaticum]MCI1819581.1 bifunctional phosphoribosylaminoimidazolecarboxamide formyltransferase/IMP cyclohydrolase [Carnobacterium maltaromaticum]
MKRALISVSDKNGIVEFAKALIENDIEIISTGGTKKVIEEAGIQTKGIEEITGFPEMLDGRVKTLHPLIHGGLLGRRDLASHLEAMKEHNIQPIDYVCVNLYPFKETIMKADVTTAEAIENIDIGGPSMLRSAAKNYAAVTVVVDPLDYPVVIEEIQKEGETTLKTREKLAAKVFRHTASYDALIAGFLTNLVGETEPEKVTLTYDRQQGLRYGENSHQEASFYKEPLMVDFSITNAKQIHGKELSYNNIKDADAAIRIAREFSEPVAVAVKHMNPCGVGIGATIFEAFQRAYEADSVSIFGGIIVLNREVDLVTAEKLHGIFLEIILAPSFSEEALALLTKKKNLRLMTLDFAQAAVKGKEMTSVLGGLLIQDQDLLSPTETPEWQVVTERQPTKEELKAMEFAWKVMKHVKSNGIVIANDQHTLGIGAGQMNRVGSVKIALEQAAGQLDGAVLASDAFFPMSDSVEYASSQGIKAIIQPGGSIKDQESIDAANESGMTMIFTKTRHFRH